MSLNDRSQTGKEIYCDIESHHSPGTYVIEDKDGHIIPNPEYVKISNQKWVKLEDTQKEISRLKSIIETEQLLNNAEWRRAMAFEAKLKEANSILEDFEASQKGTPQPQDMRVRMDCTVYWMLKAALNANRFTIEKGK